MKEQQNIWTTIRQNRNSYIVKIGLAIVLGAAFLGLSFGTGAHSAHASAAMSSQSDIGSAIDQVFGPYADQARSVAMCESSMNPNATNAQAIGDSNAAGLFQILYPSTWYSTSQAGNSPYDVMANTIAAHDIFVRDGYSWREWVCQP